MSAVGCLSDDTNCKKKNLKLQVILVGPLARYDEWEWKHNSNIHIYWKHLRKLFTEVTNEVMFIFIFSLFSCDFLLRLHWLLNTNKVWLFDFMQQLMPAGYDNNIQFEDTLLGGYLHFTHFPYILFSDKPVLAYTVVFRMMLS